MVVIKYYYIVILLNIVKNVNILYINVIHLIVIILQLKKILYYMLRNVHLELKNV